MKEGQLGAGSRFTWAGQDGNQLMSWLCFSSLPNLRAFATSPGISLYLSLPHLAGSLGRQRRRHGRLPWSLSLYLSLSSLNKSHSHCLCPSLVPLWSGHKKSFCVFSLAFPWGIWYLIICCRPQACIIYQSVVVNVNSESEFTSTRAVTPSHPPAQPQPSSQPQTHSLSHPLTHPHATQHV